MNSVEEKHISPPACVAAACCRDEEVSGGKGNEFGFDNQPRPIYIEKSRWDCTLDIEICRLLINFLYTKNHKTDNSKHLLINENKAFINRIVLLHKSGVLYNYKMNIVIGLTVISKV